MSLNEVCYENIKDNFYYGDYLGFKLIIDKSTGFFNATKLCAIGKKQYKAWYRNQRTKDLISYVRGAQSHRDLKYEIKGNNKKDFQITGTYIHEDLILDLSLWISHEFYIKCKNIITDFATSEFKKKIAEQNNIIKEKDDTITRLEKMMIEMRKELKEQNNEILAVNEDLRDDIYNLHTDFNRKMDKVLPDRNVDPDDPELLHNYCVLQSKLDTDKFSIIRGQDKHIDKKIKEKSSTYDVIIGKTRSPNPIDLNVRIKEHITRINEEHALSIMSKLIDSEDYQRASASRKNKLKDKFERDNRLLYFTRNNVILKNYSEEQFIELVKKIDDERYDV